MIRKELTLEATYVPNWGLNEGIREFISNAFDAQTEMSCEVDVHYAIERKKLFIVTKGAVLSREVLLFGHSSKAKRGDTIGHFGEGLKLVHWLVCALVIILLLEQARNMASNHLSFRNIQCRCSRRRNQQRKQISK